MSYLRHGVCEFHGASVHASAQSLCSAGSYKDPLIPYSRTFLWKFSVMNDCYTPLLVLF